MDEKARELMRLNEEIVRCRKCPRLVVYREAVAREKRLAFREWDYWGKPVPGFGDPHAKLLILGLAPAAHGANRTGQDVHRRSFGRFFVQGDVQHRIRESADIGANGRRAQAEERLHFGRGTLRAAGQQAATVRTRELPALFRARAGNPAPEGDFGAGRHRDARLPGDFEARGENSKLAPLFISAWRELFVRR